MSYDNAEPKVLKTLNSSGQVLDDAGNVISDTTSYWEKKYVEAEPKPDKILKSDGTIVDAAGNQIQAANEYNVKKYNQAEPIPAKYLHADGTIDENSGGGSANLEENKTVSFDTVGTKTILPSNGYDGMKRVTADFSVNLEDTRTVSVSTTGGAVTVIPSSSYVGMKKAMVLINVPTQSINENITENGQYSFTPQIGSLFNTVNITVNIPLKLYAWTSGSNTAYTLKENPSTGDFVIDNYSSGTLTTASITSVSHNEIKTGQSIFATTWTRDISKDISA